MLNDYLSEVLLLYGAKNRRNGTYQDAMRIKRRGDAVIFNQLCKKWCSRYKWESDEKSIATELLEKTLLYNGVFGLSRYIQTMKDDYSIESWRNFMVTDISNESFYGYPNTVRLTDYVGHDCGKYIPVHDEDDTDIANCALVYADFGKIPPLVELMHYAERLSQLNTSIGACTQNVLGTSIIHCTHGQERQIIKQMTAARVGVPYVVTYDENDIHPTAPTLISTPETSASLVTLYEAYDKTLAEFYQSIGINVNAEVNRKSGITPLELVENRHAVSLTLNDGLNARLKGIEHFERIGGSGLRVTLANFDNQLTEYDSNGQEVGAKAEERKEEEEEGKEKPDDSVELE